jgi:anti-anti-sigma regulatory factor
MGMGILLEARQLAAKRNGDVVILNLPKKISKVFEILGFNEIFKLYSSS